VPVEVVAAPRQCRFDLAAPEPDGCLGNQGQVARGRRSATSRTSACATSDRPVRVGRTIAITMFADTKLAIALATSGSPQSTKPALMRTIGFERRRGGQPAPVPPIGEEEDATRASVAPPLPRTGVRDVARPGGCMARPDRIQPWMCDREHLARPGGGRWPAG
jgi:hypothetical protein